MVAAETVCVVDDVACGVAVGPDLLWLPEQPVSATAVHVTRLSIHNLDERVRTAKAC
jgi:hypothetical protein